MKKKNIGMTISELYDKWLADKSETADPNTIKCCSLHRRYICDKFGERQVNGITCEEWRAFENELPNAKKQMTAVRR